MLQENLRIGIEYGADKNDLLFLLPNGKPLTIKQALDYILNYRKEKSLQKAVFRNSKYNQQPSSEDTELINSWFDENVVQKNIKLPLI